MMDEVLERRSKQVRRLCQVCHQRKARFQYRGHVRADRDHTLCFECFRAEQNRQRAAYVDALTNAHPCLTIKSLV